MAATAPRPKIRKRNWNDYMNDLRERRDYHSKLLGPSLTFGLNSTKDRVYVSPIDMKRIRRIARLDRMIFRLFDIDWSTGEVTG